MPVDPRYPIGKFEWKGALNHEQRQRLIAEIEQTPAAFRAAARGLTEQQLDTPYREGGWTVRQVIHHVPDSHLNSYIRFKLALTEDEPTIKSYDEKLWAQLPDSRDTPVETSLTLLENLHRRWVILLRSMKPADFSRKFRHPSMGRFRSIGPWPSTDGMGRTTRRTSPPCVNVWGGSDSL